jgi:hypothetical protein
MEQNPARVRRRLIVGIGFPLVIGCVEFSNIARNPRFEQIHNVDIVGLMGVGACFGVAIIGIAMMIRMRSRIQ